MSNLFQLLTDLALDPQKQVTFGHDPEAVMAAARLAEVDRVVIRSGARNKISAVFAGELPELSLFCIDPGPDPLPDPDPPPEPDSSEEE